MRQPHLTATGKKGSPILQHLLHGESLQRQQILFSTHIQLDLLEGVQSITCTIVKTCGGSSSGAFVRQSALSMQMEVIHLCPDRQISALEWLWQHRKLAMLVLLSVATP